MRNLLLTLALLLAGCSQPPQPSPTPASTDQPLRSLVYLLDKARDYKPAELQNALEKALGEKGRLTEDDPESTTIQLEKGWKLAYLHRNQPYLSSMSEAERKEVEESLLDPDLRKKLQRHQAWIAMDVLEQPPGSSEEEAYARLGKLMVELGGPDTLLLLHPGSDHVEPYSEVLSERLLQPHYLVELGFVPEPTTQVASDDAAMAAAEEEARQGLPHFRQRFQKREKGEQFYVKAPFQVDSMLAEFMWVEVTAMDETTVKGKLANDPESIKSLKLGDPVEIPLARIDDWTILDARGKRLEGSFTEKVLEQK